MKKKKAPNSILYSLRVQYLVIIFVMATATLVVFVVGHFVTLEYGKIPDRLILFDRYIVALNDLSYDMEMVVRYEADERENSFLESRGRLLVAADDIREAFLESPLSRFAIDLWNMARTISNEGTSSVRLMVAGYDSAAVPIYENARRQHRLIHGYYYSSYQELLDLMSFERSRADVLRVSLSLVSLGIIAVLILTSLYLGLLFSRRITSPITTLTKTVSTAAVSETRIDSICHPAVDIVEVERLYDAYSRFSMRINRQFEKILRNAELSKRLHAEEIKNMRTLNLLKESELRALQSRINPHFMFNSVNMIRNVAYIEGATRSADLLEALGGFLRYNFDKMNKIVTLSDEIENVRDYLLLQSKRLGPRLSYEIKVQEEALTARMPCLVLQPLVENSVMHGIGTYLEDGEIQVAASLIGQRLQMEVVDNGLGLKQELIQELGEFVSSNSTEDDGKGIGLRNVISRLKLFFENDIVVSFESVPKEKTLITINIPIVREAA